MKNIYKVTLIVLSLGLSACVAQPTLEDRLAGKSEAEKQAILNEECKLEANRDHKSYGGAARRPNDYAYFSHIKRMTAICDAITKENQSKR